MCFLRGPFHDYITRSSCNYETVLRRRLIEQEAGVRWLPACEDVNLGAEDCSLLEDVTKQRIKGRDCEHYFLCDSDL
jgi:hypothetical protein